MHTLTRLQMRNLALDAVTDFNALTGQAWTVYPAHVLVHWRAGRSLDEQITALRQEGHLTLARLVALNSLDRREFAACLAYRPHPSDRISRAEFLYRYERLPNRSFQVDEALRWFWREKASLGQILAGMRQTDPLLAHRFELEVFGGPCAYTRFGPAPLRPSPARPLPRLLDYGEMKTTANRMLRELNVVCSGYTRRSLLAYWSPTTDVLAIELAMHEAGDHLAARLFGEFALVGEELRVVLNTRRPGRLDRLSASEVKRISAEVKKRTQVDIRPLWSPRVPIQHLSEQLYRQHGARVAQQFVYWSLQAPGYLL